MLVSEGSQTSAAMKNNHLEDRVVKEGMDLWKKQLEEKQRRKLKEQHEMKEMLERYWPWGDTTKSKPRGLRNLRMEELFPDKDYQNNKRFVGGGGAPIISDGRKITRTKEDPLLRFQFGSKDLRKCVDNTFRYKTNREEQMEYKKELDKLVEEKKQHKLKEKEMEKEYEKRQGWSDEETLKKLLEERKNQENEKRIKKSNRTIKLEPITHPRDFIAAGKNRKLSPSSVNGEGTELVNLLAKDRKIPHRIPLCSTDITKEKEAGKTCIWNRQGSAYLKELSQQINVRRNQMQEERKEDTESARQHFTTWSSFWGRPGHGAPRSAIKKGSLDRLLYPQMVPIGVH